MLTMITIHLMPILVDGVGWTYALSILAAGPVIGVIAMGRLRLHPDSTKLSGGKR